MSKRKMFINATQAEETRVALTEDNRLIDLDIEMQSRLQKKANIYKAKIARIEPSLNAVFVDYGSERHGFLPVKEIAPEYFTGRGGQNDIKNSLREGQELMIQIEKEERGNKGAAVTTYITLAGCYLVLMPNNTNAGGISRRIEGDERQMLKNVLNSLEIPKEMSVIVRTAGMGRSPEELEWDLRALMKLWDAIIKGAESKEAPFLIYQESDVILRSMRDYLREEISEIILDNEKVYNRVLHHVKQFRPDFVTRLHFYNDPIPLFTKYRIESQIETAYQREVTLPSGGAVVIDHTEALTSIDINSARATKADDIEATALQTNLEASDEIARQLRLRDLGGLVVIDFIDMMENANKTKVEERLAAALKPDRARVQVGQISRFGLLEMSRQRLRPSLAEGVEKVCPRCNGQGVIRDVQSLVVSMLRLIKEQASKAGTTELILQLPLTIAAYLSNEKRDDIHQLEKQHGIRILLIPNPHMETPNYDLKRRTNKMVSEESHNLLISASTDTIEALLTPPKAAEEPLVKMVNVEAAPIRGANTQAVSKNKEVKKPQGLFSKIKALFASNDTEVNKAEQKTAKPEASKNRNPSPNQGSQRRPRSADGKNQPPRGNKPAGEKPVQGGQTRDGAPKPQGQGQQSQGQNQGRNNRNKPNEQRRKPADNAQPGSVAADQQPQQQRERTPRPPRNRDTAPRTTEQQQLPLAPAHVDHVPTTTVNAAPAAPKVQKILTTPPVKTTAPAAFTPSAAAPVAPKAPRSTVGKMQIQEVVQTTDFSLEQAREKLAKHNAAPMQVVESQQQSLLPKQKSVKQFEVQEVSVSDKKE